MSMSVSEPDGPRFHPTPFKKKIYTPPKVCTDFYFLVGGKLGPLSKSLARKRARLQKRMEKVA